MKKLMLLAIVLAPALGRAQVTAAEEAYRQAESRFHIYMEAEITATQPRELLKQLKRKTEMLQELEKAYQKVIKFKEPVFMVSSAYKLGLAYENMAAVLKKIPAPAKLTPEQQQIYKQELDAKALPFEEKAMVSFRAAVKKAKEVGAYTDHARLAEERLRELDKKEKPAE